MIIVGMSLPRLAPRLTVGLATLVVWALAAGSAAFWVLQPGAVQPGAGGPLAGAAPAGATTIDSAAVARALGAQPEAVAGPVQADLAARVFHPQVAETRLALQGVLTHGSGGAALIAVDGRPAKPLRVGARLDGLDGRWTLRAVTPHAAVLAADGRELRLELPAPDQRPHADAPPRPGVGAPAIPAVGVSGLRPPVPTQ